MEKPKNLEEALEILKQQLTDEEKEKLKKKDPDGFSTVAHMGSGMKIRNEWELWGKETEISRWFIRQGIQHPDDKSGILTTSLIRSLQGKPLELDKQIKKYRDHWKEMGQDPDDLMTYDVDDVLNEDSS